MAGGIADGGHDGRGRGQHQGAGAEDHQDGHGAQHFAGHDPGSRGGGQGRDYDPGGPAVGQAHDTGLARVGGLHQADHALQGAVLAHLDGAHVEGPELVHGAAGHRIAGALVHGQGLAGHDGLVDGRLSADDDAVHRDGLAGQHAQQVVHAHLFGGDDTLGRAVQAPGRARGQMHQPLDARPGLGHGAFLQQGAQLHDEGHLTGGEDLADDDGRQQGQRDQHVGLDVEAREQAFGAFLDDGHAAQQHGQPGRVHRTGDNFQKTQQQGYCRDTQGQGLPGFFPEPFLDVCQHGASLSVWGVMGIHRSGMCGRLCGGCARGQAGWKVTNWPSRYL